MGSVVARLTRKRGLFFVLLGALLLVALLALAGCDGDDGEETTTTSEEAIEETTTTSEVSPEETTTTSDVSPEETTTTSIEETTTTGVEETTTTTEALSSAETRLPNGNIKAMGFIDRVWEQGGKRYLRIDYAEMLTGEEAIAAAIEAGEIAPGEDLPNDYFIRNVSHQLREYAISDSVEITTSTWGAGMDSPATWDQFKSFWTATPPEGAAHLQDMPWWIERDGQTVVRIDEQYLP